jgi:hypothetical protein
MRLALLNPEKNGYRKNIDTFGTMRYSFGTVKKNFQKSNQISVITYKTKNKEYDYAAAAHPH